MYEKRKAITMRIPLSLLKRMSEYREREGTSVTFQFCKGAELFLASKTKTK